MRVTWLSLIALACLPAFAHDLVLFQDPRGPLTVRYGHPGDWQDVDRPKLLEVLTMGAANAPDDLSARLVRDGSLYRFDAGSGEAPALVAARYDNGFWSKLPDGSFRNARRTGFQRTELGLSSFKYAKAWNGRDAQAFNRAVGHRLELVPVDAASTLKAGGTLRVRVLWDGRPVAGAKVEIGDGVTVRREEDIPRFETDAQGVARLPLGSTGWQVVAVDHDTLPAVPALADTDRHVATFTFLLEDR